MPVAHHARKKKRAHKAPTASDACTSDADCAFTSFADGECCPSLCPPRVVSKASAEAFDKYAQQCAKPKGGCPATECAPPRMAREPACVSGKCEARAVASPARQ